jgi:hypothetical protein
MLQNCSAHCFQEKYSWLWYSLLQNCSARLVTSYHCSVTNKSPSLQIFPSDSSMDHTKWDTRVIGTAIYPTMALLNHSCDPNVTKYFVGSRQEVYQKCAISVSDT